jgi:hypothetical protein
MEPGAIVAVTRPYLSKTRVGLACGHAVTSLAKVKPDRLPCEGCLWGWPTDMEIVEAAIADATPEVCWLPRSSVGLAPAHPARR